MTLDGIHPSCVVDVEVSLGEGAVVAPFCFLSRGYRAARDRFYGFPVRDELTDPIRIGSLAYVGAHSVLEPGVAVGDRTVIEPYAFLGAGSSVGNDCFLRYGVALHRNVVVEDGCVVAGFVGRGTTIEAGAQFFGSTVHRFLGRESDVDEPAPRIAKGAFVGHAAVIVGGVTIGEGAVVEACARVTADVAPGARVRA